MASYDNQLNEVKNLLPNAKNILIALPVGADIDKLSSGLSLFLSFKALGKQVSIVCDDAMKVGQSHLFGIDNISSNFPANVGGNYIITLDGVVSADGKVPALQNLDWYPEGNNLNLVFHVIPGQTFQPTRVTPHNQSSGFDLIFVIGAANLNSLGNIYNQNSSNFTGHITNIDNQGNGNFGATNIVDPSAASLSEMVALLMPYLNLKIESDVATNLLTGIYQATNSLSSDRVNADTFTTIANLLRAGGKKPINDNNLAQVQQAQSPQSFSDHPQNQGLDLSSFIPQNQPVQNSQPVTSSVGPNVESFTVPTVVQEVAAQSEYQPSPEERPSGEGVITETPEPDWLTPKVFKGTSLG